MHTNDLLIGDRTLLERRFATSKRLCHGWGRRSSVTVMFVRPVFTLQFPPFRKTGTPHGNARFQ